jgi:3-oxoacyl-[acyl-carrier protein] reductase
MPAPATRIALITGASRGLGRAMAERLADDGFFVVANYRTKAAEAKALVAAIEAKGGRAIALQGDMSRVTEIETFFTDLDQVLAVATGSNQIDVLVCNAGIIHAATIDDMNEADFDRLFDLNVKGVFFTIQNVLPRMRKGGAIVTVGTGLTRFSYPHYVAYAAGKGAVGVLTQVLAKDLGASDITVNCVAPGPVDTDLNADWLRDPQAQAQVSANTALSRVAKASDIVGVVSFLCGRDSRWITGQRIEASGGIHL